jgi:hypothetical protein
VIGENQQYYQLDGQQVFDRPLQLSERLHKSASIAQFACGSSKEVERSMSTPCAMARAYMAQIACGSSKGVERAMSAQDWSVLETTNPCGPSIRWSMWRSRHYQG